MSESADFKEGQQHGMIVAELKIINNSVQELKMCFDQFKVGMGQRVEVLGNNHIESKIKLEGVQREIEDLKDTRKKVTWAIISSVLLSVLSLLGLRK